VPKLFLASCVQHVYEGLLPVDITVLPVKIWFMARGIVEEKGGEGTKEEIISAQ
jgi:hypothetical protein